MASRVWNGNGYKIFCPTRRNGFYTCLLLLFAISFSIFCIVKLGTESLISPMTKPSAATSLREPYVWIPTVSPEILTQPPPDISEEEMMQIEQEMEKRRMRIQKLCQNKTQQIHTVKTLTSTTAGKLFIDRKHRLTWCPIYKAASTIWMEIFASLGKVLNRDTKEKVKSGKLPLQFLVRKVFPQEIDPDVTAKILPSTSRVIIVRHPFERLLSAYRDKLEHRSGHEFYSERYGSKMVERYNGTKGQVEPTFVQFLQYIADNVRFDEHWRPYSRECVPCVMNYTYILKTESLESEQRYLAKKLKLKDLVPQNKVFHHTNPEGKTTYEIAKKYFSAVPVKLLKRIYSVYVYDFQLFDYSPQEYFKLASK